MRKLFDISARLALLCLPWQTQFVFHAGSLAGFPWESGTLRLYISWIPLLISIVSGFMLYRIHRPASASHGDSRIRLYVILSALAFTVSVAGTRSWTATVVWLVSAAPLLLFAVVLIINRVRWNTAAYWMVLSVLPHALLGIQQFVTQDILGSTVLGIATHHAWTSGTSVIEHGLYRVLRAYGGFPHPNIFGGWLASSLVLLPRLVRMARTKFLTLFHVFSGALITAALVFTFSRGAWIAALLGFGIAVFFELKHVHEAVDRQSLWLLVAVVAAVVAWGAVTQWDHIHTRVVASERLEQWSLVSRATSIREGFEAWKLRPLAGWGPGAALVGIVAVRTAEHSPSTAVPEPPHAVPLVLLMETGLAGVASLVLLLYSVRLHARRNIDLMHAWPLFVAVAVIGLTDHYLWTLWPGMALAALCIALLYVPSLESTGSGGFEDGKGA